MTRLAAPIRTTLTETEWAEIKRLARERDLHASQLVAQTLRKHLLKGGKP